AVKCPKVQIPDKSLCLIPQRFAIEMVNRGWILRNTIIWHKPNPMPSSAKDRFTVDFEYIYFFVKQKRYWFEPQYEPQLKTRQAGTQNQKQKGKNEHGVKGWERTECFFNSLGRNKRTVWKIPTQAFPEAHFATYPEKLVEPMVKSGCPEFICTKCGKARGKIYEPTMKIERSQTYDGKQQGQDKQFSHKRIQMLVKAGREAGLPHDNTVVPKEFKGYTDCGCGEGWRHGIVLDPFAGSGTTCLVAAQNRRDWIGIELKAEYIEMAKRRIAVVETGVPVAEQKQGQKGLFEA
ncbi:hypothetical protein LCGC14_1753070, partial [marine sediment metagenome]